MTDEKNQAILYADYKRSPWWDRLFQRVLWFVMSVFEKEPLSKPWVKPAMKPEVRDELQRWANEVNERARREWNAMSPEEQAAAWEREHQRQRQRHRGRI